jgi:acetylornithine deacetylase
MEERFKNKAVEFLSELVRTESCVIDHGLDGNELKIQQLIAGKLESMGAEVKMEEPVNELMASNPYFTPGHSYKNRPNVIGRFKGSGEGKSLLLNGHVDAMPAGDLSKWTYGPFSAQISDGKLYGNGAVDMKGGVAAMIMAVELLKEQNIKHRGNIIVHSVVDEEGGGNGTLDSIVRGLKADAAMVLEPTGLELNNGHWGCLLVEIKVKGRSIHACMRDGGVNAIDKLMLYYNHLKSLEDKWELEYGSSEYGVPNVVVGEIHGGKAATMVPEEALLRCDIHFPPNIGKDTFERIILKELDTVDAKFSIYHEARIYQHVDSYLLDKEHEFVKTCIRNQKKVVKEERTGFFPSGCDARIINNAGKIPTVVFGPGSLLQAHSIDEYIDLDQYFRAIETVAAIIADWTNN